jgi:dCMP deaminase
MDQAVKHSQGFWDRHFLDLAEVISRPSKDPSRRVGAVIADTLRRLVGSGYNGFPRRMDDDQGRYGERLVKLKLVVHAEANAIYNSVSSLSGCVLYCTSFPCTECAKAIVQCGITRVVCPTRVQMNDHWTEDARFSEGMLRETGVVLDEIPDWSPSPVSAERLR